MSRRSSATVRAERLAARCSAAAVDAPPSSVPLSDQPCDVCRLPLPVLEVELGETTHSCCVLDQEDGTSAPRPTSTRRTTR